MDKHNNNNNNNNNNDNSGEGRRIREIRRLDAEIDSGGDIGRIEERDNLRLEGVMLLIRSRGLMEVALLLVMEAERLGRERDSSEGMEYDKLEVWYKEVDMVEKKLENVSKVIKDIEIKYKDLRVRVNKFYGIEVMEDYDEIMDKMGGKGIGLLFGDEVDNLFDGTPGEGGGIGIDEKGFGFDIGGDDGEGFKEGNPDWWKN